MDLEKKLFVSRTAREMLVQAEGHLPAEEAVREAEKLYDCLKERSLLPEGKDWVEVFRHLFNKQ